MTDLYFASKGDEICYNLDYFKSLMEYEGWDEMVLHKAKQEFLTGYFWCIHYDESYEKSNGICGNNCEFYTPKNGKNGCCKYHSVKFYSCTDETFTLKK